MGTAPKTAARSPKGRGRAGGAPAGAAKRGERKGPRTTPTPFYCRSLELRAATRLAAAKRVEKGFAAVKVRVLARHSGLHTSQVLKAARIPTSTMARRQESGVLSPEESDRLLRIGEAVDAALEMFGDDPARTAAWLQRANVALSGRTPLDLLTSDVGAHEVRHLIGRIMYGVPT